MKKIVLGLFSVFTCIGWAGTVTLTSDGMLNLGGADLAAEVTLHQKGWNGTLNSLSDGMKFPDAEKGTVSYLLKSVKESPCAKGRVFLRPLPNGRVICTNTVTSLIDQNPAGLFLSVKMDAAVTGDATWTIDNGKSGTFPAVFTPARMSVFSEKVKSVTLDLPALKRKVTFSFPKPTRVHLQDNRKWTDSFTLRISPINDTSATFKKGDRRLFVCELSSDEPLVAAYARPTVVSEGPDWIALDYSKDIEAGSALDFSNQGLQDAPAGKYGWLKNVNGHFEFEGRPGVKQRFYGVNLCFSANFLDEETARTIITRLVRLGYNTVRIHHYESRDGIVKGAKDRLTLDKERMDQLDRLLAIAIEHGVYVTTDLYTSRPVTWKDIGINRTDELGKQVYKALIALHEPAFENWKTFARNFLTHRNPYTGRRYLEEPALPLICLINEGQFSMGWNDVRELDITKKAYGDWLAKKRAACPDFMKDSAVEPEKLSTVSLYSPKSAALALFYAEMEERNATRQRAFLREIGVRALLTSINCGPHCAPMQRTRERCYDYVDDHFYVDHPRFLIKKWSLPSACGNINPVLMSGKSLPIESVAFTRLANKPFCITEWNFSGPGMYRGVGGIMTGALSALQDWSGLWRFAYSHSRENLLNGNGVPGYFDTASDPLGQASDRASVCLFLRGDLAPLEDRTTLLIDSASVEPTRDRAFFVAPPWRSAAWQTRVATAAHAAAAFPGARCLPLATAALPEVTNAPFALKPNDAITLNREKESFTIKTDRTCGGFAPGGVIDAGPLAVTLHEAPATVWVSSLDTAAIPRAKRLLLTHLTDVQGNGTTYRDETKKTLLKWGRSGRPLVRNGAADIALALDTPADYDVYELTTSGTRTTKLPSCVRDGRLCFTVSVKGPHGARILYEIVKR